MTTELTQKLENIISGHSINEDDAACPRALTQRPAAQTEREAFEAWVTAAGRSHQLKRDHHGLYKDLMVVAWWAGWQGRAKLPAPQQATPDQFADASNMVAPVVLRSVHLTRDTAGMCVVRINGRVAIRDNGDIIDHMATLEWFADTQQATPEPVDDAQVRAIGEGLRSAHDHIEMHKLERSHCKDAERIREGLAAFSAYKKRQDFAATPTQQAAGEPVGEPCGFLSSEARHALRHEGTRANLYPSRIRDTDVALYTRPAPGVPEGFALLEGIATKGGLHGVDLQYRRLGSCGWPKAWRATLISTPAVGAPPTVAYGDTPQAALAAAQAKGADHA